MAQGGSTRFGLPGANKRSDGLWDRKKNARYKLEKIIQLTEAELQELKDNPEAAAFDKRLAEAILKAKWSELDGMLTQVYGKPKEQVDLRLDAGEAPIIAGFIIPKLPQQFIEGDIQKQLGDDFEGNSDK
jgi:hypothetical protein